MNVNPNSSTPLVGGVQYGRLLPGGTRRLAEVTELKRGELFVDIGHGIGNAPLQLAATVGCRARGIEKLTGRHLIAEQVQVTFNNVVSRMPLRHMGEVELREVRVRARVRFRVR